MYVFTVREELPKNVSVDFGHHRIIASRNYTLRFYVRSRIAFFIFLSSKPWALGTKFRYPPNSFRSLDFFFSALLRSACMDNFFGSKCSGEQEEAIIYKLKYFLPRRESRR